MRRCILAWFTLLVVLVGVGTAVAQQQRLPRDYAIASGASYRFSEDESLLLLEFSVRNLGGPAEGSTTIEVFALESNNTKRLLATQTLGVLEPLGAPQTITIEIDLATSQFPPNSQQPIQIEVGIDDFELANSPIASNNVVTISVPVPAGVQTGASGSSSGTAGGSGEPQVLFTIPLVNRDISLDFSDPVNVIVLGIAAVLALVLFWLLTIILRLIFSRPPKFDNWQPPYSYTPFHDPNSTLGRRQAWQQHAQNGTILASCSEGTIHAVKQLVGRDGHKLDSWKATGIRISQYDMYGRVSRSEVIAPRGVVNKLNRVMRKSAGMDIEKLRKSTDGVAKGIIKPFKKRISKRTAMLPVALDIRFEGHHGEVRILFELYRCQQGGWVKIDGWEPEMAVVGRTITESYTYTIHGMSGGESLKEYRKRLQDDLAWLLTAMLHQPPRPKPAEPMGEPQQVPPDTLTNMQPVTDPKPGG